MTRRTPLARHWLPFALPALLTAGCAGAPTRIHTLDAVTAPAAAAAARSARVFRVDAVHVPPAFDRPELVRRTNPYTLTLSDTDRWAAPLGELIRRTLTQDLALRLAEGSVVFPDAPKPETASGLVIDILAISPTDHGVEMDASWSWIAPRGASSASTRTAAPRVQAAKSVHLVVESGQGDIGSIAAELSGLVGRLADAVAADASAG